MSYKVVQPQKNGRYYLYEVTAEWDPEKKRSKQKRAYLGPCDKEGNLLDKPVRNKVIECSPVYGPYYLMESVADADGMDTYLGTAYEEKDVKRLKALAILGVVAPCSQKQMESEIEDTYLRELIGTDWSFEQSEVCRFLEAVGKDEGSRGRVFRSLVTQGETIIYDIVCLKTDSEHLDEAEAGRKARHTGSKQVNLGLVHSMDNGRPIYYRSYQGSSADVTTLTHILTDLDGLGCPAKEVVMDRGFFSAGNVAWMLKQKQGFTIPIPGRTDIEKRVISASVSRIESPSNTDFLADTTVRGFDTKVVLVNDGTEFQLYDEEVHGKDAKTIRVVVFQDDDTRHMEIDNLYRSMKDFEDRMRTTKYDRLYKRKLTRAEKEIAGMYDLSKGDDGMTVCRRRPKAVSARENRCGRFAIMTTSDLGWMDLLIRYRKRNDIEYDFSELQSDMFNGIRGKAVQDSAEGSLFVNFLSIRLRDLLIERMKASDLCGKYWVPDVMGELKKLKISRISGTWRLNLVTAKQRRIFEALGIKPPS